MSFKSGVEGRGSDR